MSQFAAASRVPQQAGHEAAPGSLDAPAAIHFSEVSMSRYFFRPRFIVSAVALAAALLGTACSTEATGPSQGDGSRERTSWTKSDSTLTHGNRVNENKVNGNRIGGNRLNGNRITGQRMDGHRIGGHRVGGHRVGGHRVT
jgi:hypothetical protein